jgi:hypothetical protein
MDFAAARGLVVGTSVEHGDCAMVELSKGIHTVWHLEEWTNVEEGWKTPLSKHTTLVEAVQKGQLLARTAETDHVIHYKDHTVAERNSYCTRHARPERG